MPYPLVTVLLVIGAVLFSSPWAFAVGFGIAMFVVAVVLQFWLQASEVEALQAPQISEPSSPPDEY